MLNEELVKKLSLNEEEEQHGKERQGSQGRTTGEQQDEIDIR